MARKLSSPTGNAEFNVFPVFKTYFNLKLHCKNLQCVHFTNSVQCAYLSSVHYPPYSLNVASMYLKLGRLYLGLERSAQGVKALKKVRC